MMKKTKLALAITTSMIAATPAMATNGDNLIGLGAQSRALGGTGVAAFFGSENALSNPALLAKAKGNEISFGGTLFKPSVKTKSDIKKNMGDSNATGGYYTSSADTNIIPEVSIVTPISDNLSFGIGMFGSAGMGVDYSDSNELFNAQSNLQLMKFAPSLSYKTGNLGIGFSPVLQYGSLDINYKKQMTNSNGQPLFVQPAGNITTVQSLNPAIETVGSGVSSDLGWGYNIGGYMDIGKLTVGLSYQSPINMKYKDQISTAGKGFNLTFGDELEQPAEIAIGLAYQLGKLTLTGDFKQIKWADAKGYKDFKWDNQNVIALGAKYQGKGFWLGAGFNKGDNPIKEQDGSRGTMTAQGSTNYQNGAINMFNNIFFPATVEQHITFGGGYSLSKTVSIDAAIVMASESKTSVDTSAVSSSMAAAASSGTITNVSSTSTTKHSQIGYTVSVRYNF